MHNNYLLITLFGLFLLYGILVFSNTQEYSSHILPNSKVSITGKVVYEKEIEKEFRVLSINNVSVACSCNRSYLNSIVAVNGITELYDNILQIRAHSIVELK